MDDRPGSEQHLTENLPRLKRNGWVLDLHVDPQDLNPWGHSTYYKANFASASAA